MKVSLVVTFVFLWLIGVSSSVNAQSSSGIQNGSFETPSIATYAYRPSSSWTFISSAGIQHNGSAWGAPNAPDGVQTAFLQDGTTGGNGTISQVFTVPAAGTYSISFYSALRAYRTSPTLMSFNVTMDGTNIGSFSPTATAFSQFTTSSILLTAGSHTLSFVGTGAAPDTSDFIDFVTLNNVSAQLPPSNTAPPTITGTPQVGLTLTGANGSWTNAPTSFSYQWYRAGAPISGATALTYSPQTADVGSTLTLGEIAANAAGSSAQAMSAATAPVTSPPATGMAGGQVLFGVKPYTCVRNFYVDGVTGQDVSTSGSQSYPWNTIQYANNKGGLKPGDCVNVAAGTYAQPGTGGMGLTLSTGGNANAPTGYVTYIGAPNHATRITGSASTYNLVRITGSYIIIDGFDLDGTGTPNYAVSNDPAFSQGPGHHIMVLNNLIHDSGGGGVGFQHADYFTVIGNTIYNTCNTSQYQESGISIYEPAALQNFTPTLVWDTATFHITIANNIVYNNAEKMAGAHSDGNGIIIDDWLYTQQAPHTPYPYQGLVQSNLSYNNGGKGIQVFLSLNVTVANNTVFNNNLDVQNTATWRGELNNAASNNVKWINNIAWSQPNSSDARRNNTAVLMGTYGSYSLANVVWKENLTFDGTTGDTSASLPTPAQLSAFLSANRAGVNPLLRNLQPLSNSPVIASGSPTPAYPPMSLYGEALGTPPDIGAY